MSGVVLAAAHGAHITTSFLVEALPARVQRATAVLGWLAVAALYATLAWSTLNMLEIVHDERSQILGIPGSLTYRSEEHTLNSSHLVISYAVFCLKKKKKTKQRQSSSHRYYVLI